MSLQETHRGEIHRGDYHEKTEAEGGVKQSQVKESLEAPGTGKDKQGFSPEVSGGSTALPTPEFQTPNLQNHERINF